MPRRVVASWYSFVSQSPSWLPNHGPAGLPLSPPGITYTASGCERRASATKRRDGAPLDMMRS